MSERSPKFILEFEQEGFDELVPVSAKSGDNIDRLEDVFLAATRRSWDVVAAPPPAKAGSA